MNEVSIDFLSSYGYVGDAVLRRIASILYETFKDKFGTLLGSFKNFYEFLNLGLNPDKVVVTEVNDEVVGIAGLKFNRGHGLIVESEST